MADRKWTTEQQQCIDSRGGTLLVSAAAGSGKTAVLVQRIVGLLTDPEQPVDVGSLLVVTFTKAAAAEMKQRLSAALSGLIAEQPDNRRLQRQLMLLPSASISTVHSFCSGLLREYFHLLDISPDCKVAEEAETRLLRGEAMEEVLEEFYQEGEPAFLELSTLLGSGRNDKGLIDKVERLYGFIQSHPFPEEWLERQEALYAADTPTGETVWGREILRYIAGGVRYAASLLQHAAALSDTEEKMRAAYLPTLSKEYEQLTALAAALPSLGWDEAVVRLSTLSFGRLGALRNYEDESFKKRVTNLRDSAKKLVQKLLPLLCCSEAEAEEDRAALLPLVQVLFELVRRYAARYEEKKRQKRILDFNDLEHLSLRLLVERQPDGGMRRTPLAEEIAARFSHVLVDEYQDTNAAQDALFRAVSRDEQNLFMVGDVKQSIYGFRHAMPEIFIEKRDRYTAYDGLHYPAAITLGNNFRSRLEVTDSINFVFRQLMTRETCGIDYDEREALVQSAAYATAEGCETELLIVDGCSRDTLDDRDAAEARVIAGRIRELMQTFRVTDGNDSRPVRYGDFCILLRSKNAHADAYVDELNRCGVPAWTGSTGGFFAAPEIAAAVSLLRLIDNPLGDVPLLAVMLSPMFGFSPDDLATIRTADRTNGLFVAIRRFSRGDSELAERCRRFLSRLDRWRTLAISLPADRLIHRLYEESGLLAVSAARRHGAQRTANLRQLQDYARRFERGGFRGLSAFVRHLNRLERQGMDMAPASVVSEAADVVRVISIHHSKGLEFPVVFLAGLGSDFNPDSTRGAMLLHPDAGIGLVRRDPETLREFPTLSKTGVSLSIMRSERAEELRVLYVAMTRAREKLCMVMTLRDPPARLAALAAGIGEEDALPPYAVTMAKGLGDWVLMAALRHPSGKFLRDLAGGDTLSVRPADTPWHIELLPTPASEDATADEMTAVEADLALCREIERRMQYSYPYTTLSRLPAKAAASELSHQAIRREFVAVARPAFLSESGLTPSERGTALHSFMQYARYDAAAADPKAESRRLTERGFLTEQQAASLPLGKIRTFFQSALYRRITAAVWMRREFAFTIDWPAGQYDSELEANATVDLSGEALIVQGIADCVFEEDGQLVIVDYKTDHVKTPAELCERYREQLRIYAYALSRITGLTVRQCLLYSFALGREIEVT